MTRSFSRLDRHPIGEPRPTRTLVDRYLSTSTLHRHIVYETLSRVPGLGQPRIALIDTTEMQVVRSDAPALWHVIWCRDEGDASVTIGLAGSRYHWPIAPGDTVALPAQMPVTASGGQLGLLISADGLPEPNRSAPTHGVDRFSGYNRQTVAFELGPLRLCRWKITQPLDLAAHHPSSLLVMGLARTSIIRTDHAIERLQQGEAAVIDPAASPLILPDGLAYLLTIDRIPPAGHGHRIRP